MPEQVKFDVKSLLGNIKKDNDSIQKNVNTIIAASKGKGDDYRADCCVALTRLFSLTEDKSDEFIATIWEQVHDFVYYSYINIQSNEALITVIHTLTAFYETSSSNNIASPTSIKELYPNLSRALRNEISSHKRNEEVDDVAYDNLLFLGQESNLSILKTFGKEAFEDFGKMKPVLDMLLHRRKTSYEIRIGLKMYSDFVKQTSFDKRNPQKCYSYRYRHKMMPAIEKFLADDRFEVIDAACRLIISLVNYGGPIFHREMEHLLPILLGLMNKYNDCMFSENVYGINQSSVTKQDWPRVTRDLAKVICQAANRIFVFYEVKVMPIQGLEFLIYSIILCDVEKDWEAVYNFSQHIFRSFHMTKHLKFAELWDLACRFLTKVAQETDCFPEMLNVAAHILKKCAIIFCQTKVLVDEHYIVMIFYEKIDDLLKKYKTSINKNKTVLEEKTEKYNQFLTNICIAHQIIYKSKRNHMAHSFFEDLLPTCDYMMDLARYSFEHKFILLIHGDMIETMYSDMKLISKYKEKLMPIALKCLTVEELDVNAAAVRIFGKVSLYGGKTYEEDCKNALPLIARKLHRSKVCGSELKLLYTAAKFRESAASTIAKILTVHSFIYDERMILSQWLRSLPVVMNPRDAEISYDLLLRLLNENNKFIRGPNNSNMPQICTVFCYAIQYNAFDNQSTIVKKIERLLRDLVVNSSISEFNYIMANLKPGVRETLTKSVKNAPKRFTI